MMKSLPKRLEEAKTTLNGVRSVLVHGELDREIMRPLRKLVDCWMGIDHWLQLIEARATAWQYLQGLERRADKQGYVYVSCGDVRLRVAYPHARLLSMQAYLCANWALADCITSVVSPALCTEKVAYARKSPVKLVDFINESGEKNVAAVVFKSIRRAYGWPIAISYAIRNHFVHDGGYANGSNFFDGPKPEAAFKILDGAWRAVEDKAGGYGVERSCMRGQVWPPESRDDVREVLGICEQEMDQALGVLIGTACVSLCGHITFMTGAD